ncbi:GntR family transcriptional regulator [Tamaricihabitans halophyticus]|uniref:GntR family transcriptional regulator n=1 Tax=Tamaricihabitans halophyticus TaxID=1262583 RepID=A0A4R2QKQ4_9PSEU|nr:GntR family transcriptional regulator [Tamaricihabitans halophyticus]TCP50030.1 GntR family transcriptional regulator [Tamaricihabitans halophyticus]
MSAPQLPPLPARPGNLTDLVLAALQRAIIEQQLPPGQQVSEASLADSLQVSKTPVREALLRLRHIGLVETADRGLRVTMPSASRTRYAYELRAGLERSAATLAAERCSDAELVTVAEAAQNSLEHALHGDADGFRACDLAFHQSVCEAARNPLLEQAVRDALLLTGALRARDVPISGDSVGCAREHLAVSDALAERDGHAAGRAMYAHVQHVMRIVLDALGEPDADG